MKKVKIISRPKLNGLGRHYGVMLEANQCYDFQPFGIRKITLEDFAQGYHVKTEQEVPLTDEIFRRIQRIGNKKIRYGLIKFNCESFARYLVTGKAQSNQVRYAAATSLAAGLCYYLLRTPLNSFLF